MKYTAEEVRKSADWLYQWERKAGARNARAMLTAYAERIEADEVAVTDLVVDKICNAALGHDNYGYETQDQVRTALLSVWPKPPAQAAQVDAFADRLRQSIMRDTFQPTADPVAQGEACKICGKDTPHHHLRGTQVRYRSIQEEWSEWLEFNLVCADAALWKLSAMGAITPPEAASIKAVIAGARAMLAAPSAPEGESHE